MLGYLRGRVAQISTDRTIIDVNGIGFEVFVSALTAKALKKDADATLITHVNFAQDSVSVFGFLSEDEKEVFRRLISVSRVGPKVAISVLSTMSAAEVAMCIVTGNEKQLAKVPGLGKKTAQRIILELKEKLSTESAFEGAAPVGITADEVLTDARAEAMAALVALGYDPATAAKAINDVKDDAATVEELLKAALRQLGKKR